MSSLTSLCLEVICDNFSTFRDDINLTPGSTLCDIFYNLTKRRRLNVVKAELSNLGTFMKILHASLKRHELHYIVQTINNDDLSNDRTEIRQPLGELGSPNPLLGTVLAASYAAEVAAKVQDVNERPSLFKNGLLLGEFLYNAGWFYESAKVLGKCLFVSLSSNDIESFKKSLQCLEKLLLAQSYYSMFQEARKTYETANVIIEKLKTAGVEMNLAKIYSAFAGISLMECRYNDALKWSVEALKELNPSVDTRVVVDVLRQSAKSCAVKREFAKAELLITEAVYLARDFYGSQSVKYADALLDYGYLLINRDSVQQAVLVYSEVLQIRKEAFGTYNFMTAIALEDLSYALYVQEYSSGRFASAREYSNEAITVMTLLLPKNHLQLASAKRVKALILEEIAIDSVGSPGELTYLVEAEQLHLSAWKLAREVFGEMNVQTAKHYGNLGRLYQTMKKYSDAEFMHLKAIAIKETLLGMYDYEVSLSVGHLASLYNYDMHEYNKAEQLHLRSIKIGRKLFGDAYTGLEYDYRGLLSIYGIEGNLTKLSQYNMILSEWKQLQDMKSATSNEKPIRNSTFSRPVSQVLKDFFKLDWTRLTESDQHSG